MIPDMEKQMKDKLERALIHDVMPDFDEAGLWQNISAELHPARRQMLRYFWPYAAAVVVLITVGVMMSNTKQMPPESKVAKLAPDELRRMIMQDIDVNTEHSERTADTKQPQPEDRTIATTVMAKKGMDGERIKNGTPCPIAICISQTVKCPNALPEAIHASSTLEPGQSARLNYRGQDSIARNCSLTIREIEIKSIATGETIVLDAHSSPSTVQDVYSYITGERTGDVLAGMFTTDCNKQKGKHSLRLHNRNGDLILQ